MQQAGEISLSILVVDADETAARALTDQAARDPRVVRVAVAHSTEEAQRELLRPGDYNTIVIDPLSIGIDRSSDFIFTVRSTQPKIVFVLYVNSTDVDSRRTEFFSGERQRFARYYSLDKRTPVSVFPDEVHAMLTRCFSLLSWMAPADSLEKIKEMLGAERDRSQAAITRKLSNESPRRITSSV